MKTLLCFFGLMTTKKLLVVGGRGRCSLFLMRLTESNCLLHQKKNHIPLFCMSSLKRERKPNVRYSVHGNKDNSSDGASGGGAVSVLKEPRFDSILIVEHDGILNPCLGVSGFAKQTTRRKTKS